MFTNIINNQFDSIQISFRLQAARLKVLKKMLQEREEYNNEANTKRLDKLWSKKQKEKEKKFDKIRAEHIKSKNEFYYLLYFSSSDIKQKKKIGSIRVYIGKFFFGGHTHYG